MRDETEGSARDSGTSQLPWTAWMRALPDTARDAVSDVDPVAPHVYLRMPALPHELPTARAELRRWSQALKFSSEQAEDVVLAVDEAVANAVEHAYTGPGDQPGAVTVFAGRLVPGDAVRVVVSDVGHWRPPLADTGFRGRGVSMMKALADHFDLHHNENGTTVLLGWNVR
ncbi:MAG: ATP-binding protein [Kibdelosporangium sp.]